uniref:DUSP domain-containing protein n=1 Tax=Euplotes harpa TaxID=151035 RepID=A0A7S3J9M2_9SPIT|mmetsp:Transcript_24272/g.27960  ORF Transcript_24272/g.27960 Transcript_24272/m.27960 type:complete len:108 (+) Transcript_24272:262-585(+)
MFIENNRNLLAMGSKKADTEGVGVLDPGPISNNNLFDESGLLKQDLEMAKDYRLVNESVWRELFEIYGGGPPIKRSHPDIYSEELSVEEEVKLANKKLRKFKRDDRK